MLMGAAEYVSAAWQVSKKGQFNPQGPALGSLGTEGFTFFLPFFFFEGFTLIEKDLAATAA